jgi:hypothetical protein
VPGRGAIGALPGGLVEPGEKTGQGALAAPSAGLVAATLIRGAAEAFLP